MKKQIYNFIRDKIVFLSGIILLILVLVLEDSTLCSFFKLKFIDSTIFSFSYGEDASGSENSISYYGKSSSEDSTNSLMNPIITLYRSNGTELMLPLEEYLIGVVGAEMPASFYDEALRAQAVVARTYALKKIQDGCRLTDTISTQSYKDNEELKQLWGPLYSEYYQRVKSAVDSTKGYAIYYQGNYIDALYHSTSNGKTEDAFNVWGNSIPYLKSVDSIWDKGSPSYIKNSVKDFSNVLNLLGVSESEVLNFEILSRNGSGRVQKVKIGNQIFSGVQFRDLLGLRSTDFDISIQNNSLVITTRGFGHGVGMSQYGANGMAEEGYSYQQILQHYYTNINIY